METLFEWLGFAIGLCLFAAIVLSSIADARRAGTNWRSILRVLLLVFLVLFVAISCRTDSNGWHIVFPTRKALHVMWDDDLAEIESKPFYISLPRFGRDFSAAKVNGLTAEEYIAKEIKQRGRYYYTGATRDGRSMDVLVDGPSNWVVRASYYRSRTGEWLCQGSYWADREIALRMLLDSFPGGSMSYKEGFPTDCEK